MFFGGFLVGISIGVGLAFAVNCSWAQQCRQMNEEWYETCLEIINMDVDEEEREAEDGEP